MEIVKTTKKIPKSRKVVLNIPENFKTGQIVELTVSIEEVSTSNGIMNTQKTRLNLAEWAEKNAIEFEEPVQSTDVESFTGRNF